jgi:predicted nucleic-acid-binding protein
VRVRAVDTNVLARYYLQDDPAQGQVARKVIAAGDVFVPKTVVLELEWVLRYVAEQPRKKVLDCISHLLALPGVTLEDHEQIEVALALCRQGLDFADALHHSASHACAEMLTFDDRGFARRAARLDVIPTVYIPKL